MIESDLAVVIVNYNTGDYLERCLRSLERAPGRRRVDVLVIDNASRDGSHRRAIAAHPWARLIENDENVFLSPAWNQGLRETSAPFVLFLNPMSSGGREPSPITSASPSSTRVPASWARSSGTRTARSTRAAASSLAVRRRRTCVPRHASPGQPVHPSVPHGWLGPEHRARSGLGLGLLHAIPTQVFEDVGPVR